MSRYAVLSDVHGNLYALEEVIKDANRQQIDKIIMLGDLIDYGMQSNEVVTYVASKLQNRLICNIWGNHERAILTPDYRHFSSQRGVDSARHTAALLTENTIHYLTTKLDQSGQCRLDLDGLRALAIHGSLDDPYWKAIFPDNLNGQYQQYEIVLSGHSHYPHAFYKFYECDDPQMRNKKAVLFVNPGSVGQPRNHNPNAQYAVLDTETMGVQLRAVPYPKEKAMFLFDGSVDDFYRSRLDKGV